MKQGFRWFVTVAGVLALVACRAPASGQANSASMELKIYAVPATETARLADALGSALGKKANVTAPLPGKLLVYAPRDAQASIASALDALDKTASAQPATTQVNLRFWIVDAKSGPGTDDDALAPLTATLNSLRRATGPMHFQLEQSAAAMAASGHSGRLVTTASNGYPRSFGFDVRSATNDGITLSLDYQDAGPGGLRQFSTLVSARFGQYLVLAQAPEACPVAPSSGKPSASSCPDQPVLQLLVVSVDRTNEPA